jgi:hypothetical protein
MREIGAMNARSRAHSLEALAAWEPSFQQIGPNTGRFTLPHLPDVVSVRRESLGWHTLSLPLPDLEDRVYAHDIASVAAQLLRVQHCLIAPVKFGRERHAGRYCLIGELAPGSAARDDACKAMFMGIREGLAQGMASLSGLTGVQPPAPHREGARPQDEDHVSQQAPPENIREQLVESLRQWGHDWSQHDTGFLIALDTARYFQKIDVHLQPKGVVYFQSQLTVFPTQTLSEASQAALIAFLLYANHRLRLARTSIVSVDVDEGDSDVSDMDHSKTAVVLEVATSAESLSPTFIEQALASLVVGARFMTLEVQALCQEDVAQAYMRAHDRGRSR